MKSILDPSFRYIASFNTDLQKTFARIRRDQQNDGENQVQAAAEAEVVASPIVKMVATSKR